MFPSLKKQTLSALSFSFIAAIGTSHAATYNWIAVRTLGTGEGLFNRANYAAPEGGPNNAFTPTSADIISLNTGARIALVNATGAIGQLLVGSSYGVTNVNQSGGSILTIQSGGSGVTTPGIEIQSGRTGNTNIHARVNFQGDVIIANNGDSRLRFGNPGDIAAPTGVGGIQGSGTLAITKGTVVLAEYLAGGHTYSGAVTVTGSNSVLQAPGGSVFNTYSSLTVGNGASISGGGSFGSAEILNGGRVSPGGDGGLAAGPNSLSFTSLLHLQSTGLAVLDIKAAGVDTINATAGTITLGGQLLLRLNSDYNSQGSYQLLLGLGPASGNFGSIGIQTDDDTASAVTLDDSDGDGIWNGGIASRGYDVTFNANTGFLGLTSIPEPTTVFLSLLTTPLLTLRRRR